MIQLLQKKLYTSPSGEKKQVITRIPNAPIIDHPSEIFSNHAQIMDSLGVHSNANIFWTHAQCHDDGNRRAFKSQSLIGFDIDKCNQEQATEIANVLAKEIGIEVGHLAYYWSGNGLHAFIEVETWHDVEFFNAWRPYYKQWCQKIERALKAHSLTGKCDPDFFTPGRMGRLPGSINYKKSQGPKDVVMLSPCLTKLSWDITKIELESAQTIPEHIIRWPTPEPEEVMQGCDFLRYCGQKEVSEPEWYAALSIVARLPGGNALAHQLSAHDSRYDQAETEAKIEQAASNAGPRTCKNIEGMWEGCKDCKWYNKLASPIQIKKVSVVASEATGFYCYNEQGKAFPDYDGLIKHFNHEHSFVVVRESRRVLVYRGKYWEGIDRNDIRTYAGEMFNPSPADKIRIEFYNRLTTHGPNVVDRNWSLMNSQGTINFTNGVYDTKDMLLRPHCKEYSHTYVLDYAYDPLAKCPKFDQFMLDIMCNRQDLVQVLLEYMGYVLCNHPNNAAPKALVLLGDGANGKSTFINLLCSLVSEEAYSVVGMDQLGNEKARMNLVGKLFNINEEFPYQALKQSHDFKNLVSGGRFSARKLYENSGTYQNQAKFIFATNEMPTTYDNTDGMLRRLLIVPFDAKFKGDNCDPYMLNGLLQERAGILNRVLRVYVEFKQRNLFTESPCLNLPLEEFKLENDHIYRWLMQTFHNFQIMPGRFEGEPSFTPKNDLWQAYLGFCLEQNIKTHISQMKFFKKLSKFFGPEREGRKYINGLQVRGILGLTKKARQAEQF